MHLGLIKTNCYLVESPGAAVVIDPGFQTQETVDFLAANAAKERMILITHSHFDHIGGAPALREVTGVPIGIGKGDSAALADPAKNLADRFHAHFAPFVADRTFADGETVQVGDLSFRVIETPGHTVGGVSYLLDGVLFSGDTLFEGTVGRTDFPGGDFKALKKSLRRLMTLDGEVRVLSGHGDETTIARERQTNLFLR